MLIFLFLMTTPDTAWQWPMEVSESPTSSFGEYRGSRFHMGLDFSTGGVEGKKVRPALPGVVFKIRATISGFGRVVYVRHKEHITVYAHLSRFGPKLETMIREKNKDPLDWFGTLDLDLPISREDLLAYTGESGAGMPHLHFEVRDAANRPVDPLALPFPKIPDLDKPALLKSLRFLPLSPESLVNGQALPFQSDRVVSKIQARGKIGVQLHAYAQGSRGNKLGCRGVRVKADDIVVGQWLPRHLDFAFNGNAGLVYDQSVSGFGPTRYYYSFDDRFDFLPNIPDHQQNVVLDIQEPTVITIELMNLMGKWRTHQLTLDPAAGILPASDPLPSPIQSTSLNLTPYENRLFIRSNLEGTLQTPDRIIGIASGEALIYTVKPNQTASPLIWRTGQGSLKRQAASFNAKGKVQLTLENWTLKGEAKLPQQVVVLGPPDHRINSEVLEYQSQVLRFGRPGLPARNLEVQYNQNSIENPTHVGIYAWSHQKGAWRYLGGTKDNLKASLNYLAPLVVARDISPPLILKPKRHQYFTGERVVIPIREKGSGINSKSLEIMGPKGPLSGVYDSDRRWVILPRGSMNGPWTITISDNAGNQTRSTNLR